MAKRTLTSCWKQYEKLGLDYVHAGEKAPAVMKKIEALTTRANADELGAALVTLFVKPYVNLNLKLEFTSLDRTDNHAFLSSYDEASSRILLHPVAICRFIEELRAYQANEAEAQDFLLQRYRTFLREIGKLPTIYILFLVVLQRVAYLLQIAHLEKRGGIVEVAEGENYHTFLWAFKELEIFARKQYGINIRAHYRISWYEADWITGR